MDLGVVVEIQDLDDETVKEHLSKLQCALVWRHLSIIGSNLSIQMVFVPVNRFVTKIQHVQEKH